MSSALIPFYIIKYLYRRKIIYNGIEYITFF